MKERRRHPQGDTFRRRGGSRNAKLPRPLTAEEYAAFVESLRNERVRQENADMDAEACAHCGAVTAQGAAYICPIYSNPEQFCNGEAP